MTLKYLKTAHEFFPGTEPIEAKLFEAESSVGGTFKHRVYESAEVRLERTILLLLSTGIKRADDQS